MRFKVWMVACDPPRSSRAMLLLLRRFFGAESRLELPEGWAWGIARRMLECAVAKCRAENPKSLARNELSDFRDL
jgi:hypothetical protein